MNIDDYTAELVDRLIRHPSDEWRDLAAAAEISPSEFDDCLNESGAIPPKSMRDELDRYREDLLSETRRWHSFLGDNPMVPTPSEFLNYLWEQPVQSPAGLIDAGAEYLKSRELAELANRLCLLAPAHSPPSPETAIIERFRTDAKRVFSAGVHAPQRPAEEQLEWWASFYKPRPSERASFVNEFLSQHAPVCRVSGQIGSGKTTFVLDKLENPASRVCNGIWIDVGQYAGRLGQTVTAARREYARLKPSQTTSDEWTDRYLSEALNRIVARTIRKRFRNHFLRLDNGLDVTQFLHTDVTHMPEVEYRLVSPDVRARKDALYWRQAAAALLTVRDDHHAATVRDDALPSADSWSSFAAIKELAQHLEADDDLQKEAIKVDGDLNDTRLVTHWCDSYVRFFHADHPVLVFDNVDRMFSPWLHGAFIDYVSRLATAMCAASVHDDQATTGPPPMKVIYTIRDWNVRLREAHATRDFEDCRIVLGEPGQGCLLDGNPSYLELDDDLLDQIISARTDALANQYRKQAPELFDSFQATLKRIWRRDKGGENIPLADLANRSIRLALRGSCDLALNLLSDLDYDYQTVNRYLTYDYPLTVRGRVIQWLFDPEVAGHDLAPFVRQETQLIQSRGEESHLCCVHRLLLTFLCRIADDKTPRQRQIKVSELCSHLHECCGVLADHVKEALLFLFQPANDQAEYVCIYQLDSPDREDALVHITPRGRALVRHVMPRPEYWCHVARVHWMGNSLFELRPAAAVELFEHILKMLRRMTTAHKHNWRLLVENYMDDLDDESAPFAYYRDSMRLTIGNTFYLERVCDSCSGTLQNYVETNLFGTGCPKPLFPNAPVNEPEWPRPTQDFRHKFGLEPKVNAPYLTFKKALGEFSELLTSARHRQHVKRILRAIEGFGDLGSELAELRLKTRAQVLEDEAGLQKA